MLPKTAASLPVPEPEAPNRRVTDVAQEQMTVIGPGTRIKGDLSGGDPVDLAGVLEGSSSVTGLYRVREGARVTGDVTATSIVVEGEVSGRMLTADKVEIGTLARVRANVRARFVAIAQGAFFDGYVRMEGRNGPASPTNFREKRKGRRRDDPTPTS